MKTLITAVVSLLLFGAASWASDKLTIKGLYLGMPLEEAQKVADEKIGPVVGGKPCVVGENATGKTISMTLDGGILILLDISADEEGKVDRIFLEGTAVNKLFNVADLSNEEFAHEFAKAYLLPFKKIPSDGPDPTRFEKWHFDSLDGTRVELDFMRSIKIEPTPKAPVRSFD